MLRNLKQGSLRTAESLERHCRASFSGSKLAQNTGMMLGRRRAVVIPQGETDPIRSADHGVSIPRGRDLRIGIL